MTDILNLALQLAPYTTSALAFALSVEAIRVAHGARSHAIELEALVSRYRRADANAAARLRLPEVE